MVVTNTQAYLATITAIKSFIVEAPGSQCYKIFLWPSLINVPSKTETCPRVEHLKSVSRRRLSKVWGIQDVLLANICRISKKKIRDKHSSLFVISVFDGEKKFWVTGASGLYYKHIKIIINCMS
jgi:hypothetical protein